LVRLRKRRLNRLWKLLLPRKKPRPLLLLKLLHRPLK
jgi:hypothetical protein